MPGYPVEVAPPPPTVPPATVGAGAAGGAASSIAAPLGVAVAVGAGIYLGLEVKRDIDRFKKNAVLPFYDGVGPWDRFNEDTWTKPPQFDEAADRKARAITDFKLWEWANNEGILFVQTGNFDAPDGFYGPGGVHGPVIYTQDGDFVNWWKHYEECPSNPAADRWQTNNTSGGCTGIADWGEGNWGNPGNPGSDFCSLLNVGPTVTNHRTAFDGSLFQCPADGKLANKVVGYTIAIAPNTIRQKDTWYLRQIDTRVDPDPFSEVAPLEVGTGTVGAPLAIALSAPRLGTPWAFALPMPGTEPGLQEQLEEVPQIQRQLQQANAPVTMTIVDYALGDIVVPDVEVEVSPDPGPTPPPPRVVPPGGGGYPRPGRGKEKKANVASVGGRAWIAFNAATETYDFVEAMWKGLPKALRSKPKRRGGRVDPFTMLKDIYDNFGSFDLANALEAYANNQIEDMIFGALGQPAKRLSQQAGISTGLQTAINWGFRRANQAGIDAALPVPVLHVDEQAGTWTVSLGE